MTNNWDKFRLLVWKNWVLQKRHKIRTSVEIFSPVVFVALLVLVRSLVEPEISPVLNFPAFKATTYPIDIKSLMITGRFPSKIKLSYSPDTVLIKNILRDSMKYMVKDNVLRIYDEIKNNDTLFEKNNFNVDKCLKKIPPNTEDILDFIFECLVSILFDFEGYPNAKELERKLIDPTLNDTSLCGIQFDDTLNDTENFDDWPKNTTLTLRFPATLRRVTFPTPFLNWKTNFLYPIFQVPGPRSRKEKYGGWPSYVREGFMPIAHSIFHEILKNQKNESDIPELWINRYPHPKFLNDDLILVLQSFISLVIMLSFNYTCINTVKSIAVEKEKQLKEVMKIMGLPSWLHWTAWFVKIFTYLMISIIIIVILLNIEWYKTESGLTGYSIFTYTPWHFVLFFMTLFIITSICYCFMISTFFSKANTAGTVAGLFWFISYIPFTFLSTDKVLPSIWTRLLSCLASNTAMAFGFQIILLNEATAEGMQWSKLFTPLTVDDSFVMGHIIIMLILDALIYLLIALYVEQVYPGSYGVPKPWYFPFKKEFWCNIFTSTVEVEDIPQNCIIDESTVEPDPKGYKIGVNILNLTKVYDKKVAVEKLKLRIFESQITVLLGHNGAGKTTTMSMLTGMFPPTSGTAVVAGYDITKDIVHVRSSLGLCPQHNVLFSDLTVAEHIYFYARLKGMSGNSLQEEINKYISLLGLENKRNALASSLSGGMQRRLSVGTALCGKSHVVLLDEPSSGMDPSARRELWDLLHLEKKGRTIILTTHFMDEAEILGERVAILSGGKLRCVGSPFFLKKKFGIGYKLTAARKPALPGQHMAPSGPVTHILTNHISDVRLYTDIGSEISYILPENESTKFETMLAELEDKQVELGLMGFGITASTLEEVFMRVGTDNKLNSIDDEHSNHTSEGNGFIDNKSNQLIDVSNSIDISSITYSGLKLLLNQWKAMIFKKWLVTLRSWILCLLQIFLPVFFVSMAIIVVRMYRNPPQLPSLTLELANGYQNSITYLNQIDNSTETGSIVKAYKQYFEKANINKMILKDIKEKNISEYYLNQASLDMPSMRIRNLAGATIGKENVTAWFSNFPYHDLPVSTMLAQNSILKSLLPNSTFTLVNHPLPFSIQSRFELLMYGEGGSFNIAFNIGFSMAFVSSFYLLFYIKENVTRSKLLQLASGISPFTMWNAALLWDIAFFFVIISAICITLVAFQQDGLSSSDEIGRLFITMLIFGWAMLPFQYLCSSLFHTPSSGFSRMCFFNFFTGLAVFLVIEVLHAPGLDLEHIADILHMIFLIIPHYAISGAIKNLNEASVSLKTCLSFCQIIMPGKPCTQMDVCPAISNCCISDNPYFEWKKPGIGAHITYMLIVGFVLYWILIGKEYKVHNIFWKYIHSPPPPIDSSKEDSDVAMEREHIASLSPDEYKNYNLLCKDVSKYYKNFLAVNQLSFGVRDAECFGLLGINGAGKTTTFKMLTGDLRISSGQAWVKGFSVNSDMKKVYKNIGYCPQFDALLEEMTGRETLEMYSLIRGIPKQRQKAYIKELSIKLGFAKHLDKKIFQYSGGNKRKLSTSIALLGDPQVVYLDEPTTGMDPVAKRLVWNSIAACHCVILTSHSMEECEALCSRIVIMVNGHLCCLGSPQHLKNKFSQGYTLIIKLKRISHLEEESNTSNYPDILQEMRPSQIASGNSIYFEDEKPGSPITNTMFNFHGLHSFLLENFPDAKIIERYQGLITYHLPDTNIRWSKIFGIMESAKESLHIEDYSVGQTSLEQIFLQFTNRGVVWKRSSEACAPPSNLDESVQHT